MAENETEELLEEGSDGALMDEEGAAGEAEEGSEPEKKWLSKLSLSKLNISKPTMIKIAIGLTVLILGVAAYFFFIAKDEVPEPELPIEAVESDSANAIDPETEIVPEEGGEIELPEMPIDDSAPNPLATEDIDKGESSSVVPGSKDEATDLIETQEEPSPLEEENLRLKQKISELEAQNKSEGTLDNEGVTNVQDKASSIPTESELFMSDFEQELRGYPAVREPNQEPVPEPKWGEFERLNKK